MLYDYREVSWSSLWFSSWRSSSETCPFCSPSASQSEANDPGWTISSWTSPWQVIVTDCPWRQGSIKWRWKIMETDREGLSRLASAIEQAPTRWADVVDLFLRWTTNDNCRCTMIRSELWWYKSGGTWYKSDRRWILTDYGTMNPLYSRLGEPSSVVECVYGPIAGKNPSVTKTCKALRKISAIRPVLTVRLCV